MGGQVKGVNGINEGQDRTEGNVVSLLQHNYYGSALHCYTCMIYTIIEGGWEGRKGENMEFKALRMYVKHCFSMQLEIKLYRQWSIEIYFALQENRGERGWKKCG